MQLSVFMFVDTQEIHPYAQITWHLATVRRDAETDSYNVHGNHFLELSEERPHAPSGRHVSAHEAHDGLNKDVQSLRNSGSAWGERLV